MASPPPTAGRIARRLTDVLLGVLVAPRCAGCDALLDRPLDGVVCSRCWGTGPFITPPICDVCGVPLPAWREGSRRDETCPRCRRERPAVDRGRSVGEYSGSLRRIVHAFKYGGRRSLGPRLAALMRARGGPLLDGADCVVPVPLHPKRERARGFNQAALLAAHLGLPVVNALARMRDTASQTTLPAARRHRNVRGAFGVRPSPTGLPARWGIIVRGVHSVYARRWPRQPAATEARHRRLADRRVVLVDDVSTTGATLEACARVLKAAGVREVRALTTARASSRLRS